MEGRPYIAKANGESFGAARGPKGISGPEFKGYAVALACDRCRGPLANPRKVTVGATRPAPRCSSQGPWHSLSKQLADARRTLDRCVEETMVAIYER